MLSVILENLELVGIAMGLFVGSVAANTLLDVYSNMRIIGAAIFPSCKYLKDAYDKLCNIFSNMNKDLTKRG